MTLPFQGFNYVAEEQSTQDVLLTHAVHVTLIIYNRSCDQAAAVAIGMLYPSEIEFSAYGSTEYHGVGEL